MIQLRDYQEDLANKIYQGWQHHRNNLAVLPTGGGKTILFSHIINNTQYPVCAVAHRQELVGQISLALAKYGINHKIIAPRDVCRKCANIHYEELNRSYYEPNAQVAVAGVDTIVKRTDISSWAKSVGLWVMDEAHHVLKKNKWGKCIEMFPNAYGLGVTATPIRADGKGLGKHSDGVFEHIAEGPTMRELIDRGFLTDYRIFAPPSNIDLSTAKVGSTGDYTKPSMKSAMKDSTVMGDVVEHYLKIAAGKLGITFAVDVETAGQIATAFRAAGVPSEVVSANTDGRARTDILRRFKRREILQLVNVDLFGEGFDLPALEVVSMARPTQSYALYAQQFGRALRTMEGKDVAIIIDHVGNCVRHGLPDASRIWSLDAREKRSSNTPNDAIPVTACPSCTMVYERTKSECPYCGHKPEPVSRSGPEFVDGDLCELDPDTLRKMRGEIERVDADPSFIRQKMINAGATGLVANSAAKQHRLRQEAQSPLRNVISWWAGVHRGRGKNDNEIYRLFYHRFGIDIMSAQAVGSKEAAALTEKIFYQLGRM